MGTCCSLANLHLAILCCHYSKQNDKLNILLCLPTAINNLLCNSLNTRGCPLFKKKKKLGDIVNGLLKCLLDVVSIPDGVTGIYHRHNPSDHTMALGSTQPLTEMSTRNISWGVKAAGV